MIEPDRIDASFAPDPAAAVVGIELDGEAVLYHEDLNAVYLLNRTATIIWTCLDGDSDLGDLAADLAEAFAADVEVVTADVIDAVRDLGRQGLLAGVQADPDAVSAGRVSAVTPNDLADE